MLGLLLCGSQSVFGYALLGPDNEGYQVGALGYFVFSDVGTPKNFGQGYRWNTPTNYYAYDETFLEYFGSNGVVAVDSAFNMFNTLSNATWISTNLNSFPLQSSRVNFRASALQLVDLKSQTMSAIIEQLGLAEPDRWTWCLHDRFPIPGAPCPNFDYLIIQRNFDPFTHLYSSFVNGVFYDYEIEEFCGLNPNPFAPVLADAFEIPVDPLQQTTSFGSVAANIGSAYHDIPAGMFFTGFTRDDVGGLSYLYSATNAFNEQPAATSLQLVTNANISLLVTSNLALFLAQASTNDAPTLTALYPGLVITATTNFFTNVVTTNVTAFLTNPPFAPAGTVQIVLVTNFTTNVQQLFFHTFANVVTNHVFSKGFITVQTTSIDPVPFAPAGTFQTNVHNSTSLVNFPNGDFFIVPPNLCGGFDILPSPPNPQLVQVITTTNIIPVATNIITVTNGTGGSTTLTASFITYFTNYTLLVRTVDCVTNGIELREGIEHVSFVRQDFDSLLGRAWTPVTNFYHQTAITNGAPVVETFRRILTAPDILISAQDLTSGPAAVPFVGTIKRTAPNFNQNAIPATPPGPGQAEGGPGTMQPFGREFTFNSVGPIFENSGPFFNVPGIGAFFFQTNSIFVFQWGSFDGTTNDPIVYPDTQSIASLEAQLFFQITTVLLPTGNVGVPYGATLQALGASPPYHWALAQNSPGLPPGLMLSADGTISGTPTKPGVFDFTVQTTDLGARVAQKELFIEVDP